MREFTDEFESTGPDAWAEKVKRDLKTDNIDSLLHQVLNCGVVQEPYCHERTLPQDHWTSKFRNHSLNHHTEWQGPRYWLNLERLEGSNPSTLNQLALNALQSGADGVEFSTSTTKYEHLLADINLAHCYLGYQGSLDQAQALGRYLETTELLAGHLRITNQFQSLESLGELVSNLSKTPLRCLTLYETSGHGDQIRHSAMLVCKGIYIVNTMLDQGLDLELITKKLHFEVSMGDQYLWEICRLRVLRIILTQVLAQFGLPPEDCTLSMGARTQKGAGTDENGELQMLHNATQSMAAILGGCDLLSVAPHVDGFASEDPHQRRIARNVGLLLRDESYLNKAGDVVAGSYYLEKLMDQQARSIWQQVQEIEAGGGFIKFNKTA